MATKEQIQLIEKQIEAQRRYIEEQRRYIEEQERELDRLQNHYFHELKENFVLVDQNETFENHMIEVDYPKGYYTQIHEVFSDAKDLNSKVFNLLGEEIKND